MLREACVRLHTLQLSKPGLLRSESPPPGAPLVSAGAAAGTRLPARNQRSWPARSRCTGCCVFCAQPADARRRLEFVSSLAHNHRANARSHFRLWIRHENKLKRPIDMRFYCSIGDPCKFSITPISSFG